MVQMEFKLKEKGNWKKESPFILKTKTHAHLNEGACIGPSNPHQDLHIRSGKSHQRWGDDGEEWEEAAGSEEGVTAVLSQTQALEVVPERDGDDGEVCAQGEDWEHEQKHLGMAREREA